MSLKPPKETTSGLWKGEKTSHGIYKPFKELKIVDKLLGLENIIRARNDGHTPHPPTPYHNIPRRTNPCIHKLPQCPLPPKYPNKTHHFAS